ncbi:Probable ADP,ATP carrier protein At5g56450 [Linum perenne]
MLAGVVHTIVAPIERTKLLLQTQESNMAILGGGHRKFKGMVDCIVRTVKEEGVLSLWRGNGSSVLRYYPSVALNFSLKVHLIKRPVPPCFILSAKMLSG